MNKPLHSPPVSRRHFIRTGTQALSVAGVALELPVLLAQTAGERPPRAEGVTVLNPRARVPVGLIIDDSTCLVNLNRFAVPQFDEAFGQAAAVYKRDWREFPSEIPDRFVRKFGEWCAEHGVKG